MVKSIVPDPGAKAGIPVRIGLHHGYFSHHPFEVKFARHFVAHLLPVFMSQLEDDSRCLNCIFQLNGFFDAVCHGFFEVNMFARLCRCYCHWNMGMVGGGNNNCINLITGNHITIRSIHFCRFLSCFPAPGMEIVCRNFYPALRMYAENITNAGDMNI